MVALVIALGLFGLVPSLAAAQASGPQPATGPADPPAAASAAAPPSASGSASARQVVPATGYGWSTKPAAHSRGRSRAVRASGGSTSPNGTVIPGFEMLGDGSSRVFVQLPRAAPYSAKPAKGSLTYVLKGVHVDRRNNLNALVTVHFDTPVTRARLVPHGSDLWLVMDLRAGVTPVAAMDATKDGGAMLRVAFPKGDYLSDATALASRTVAAPGRPDPAAQLGPAAEPAAAGAPPAPSGSAYAPRAPRGLRSR